MTAVPLVTPSLTPPDPPPAAAPGQRADYARAVDARDPRFDGVFFVGITTTRIYCRPVCPSRFARADHRRFFDSAAAAERAGYRPCLRCRPELAPGRGGAVCDVVSRLARAAVQRITAGALNGRSVAALAGELGVSERHLRRALERELGVSPLDLAQTQRLLLAKRLLSDTRLPVTRIAYASGFQSLRRFNAAFHGQYGMPPSAVRRWSTAARPRRPAPPADGAMALHLTLTYRAPFAWDALLASLRRQVIPGVDLVTERRYAAAVRIEEHRGTVVVGDDPAAGHLTVEVSASLLPALMPLIAGLRRLFDLDADPAAVDAHLSADGLAALVTRRPGIRIPGALDGFAVALRALLGGRAQRVAAALSEPLATGIPGLRRAAPTAARVAEAGVGGLVALGVPRPEAERLTTFAAAVANGSLRLEPGPDPMSVRRALCDLAGLSERLATGIVLHALSWPDAFPAADRALQRAAGIRGAAALLARAERWRPWRAYAAMHLWAAAADGRLTTP